MITLNYDKGDSQIFSNVIEFISMFLKNALQKVQFLNYLLIP